MELPQYADAHKAWKYSELECKVDPLEEIVKEFEGGNYNLGKIAFLKELGRAAYQNPLSSGPVRRQREKKEIVILGQAEIRAEGIAKAELQDPPSHAVEVRVCPVCGANSLVVFQHTLSGDEFMDMVLDYSPDEPIAVEIGQKDVYAVECVCCSFNVDFQLKNPREYGLPIEDYWRTEYPSR